MDFVLPLAVGEIELHPLPHAVARQFLVRYHYLHSYPGATVIAIGVFARGCLLGAMTFGAGPINGHKLVADAVRQDCLTLTRLWLHDCLPRNSESRAIKLAFDLLRRNSEVKFALSYADPAAGHVGTIYQATNWVYTGLSQAQPQMDLGDGTLRHLRTVASAFGTHSRRYLMAQGLSVTFVRDPGKHRYIYFLDRSWRSRLCVLPRPYPKRGEEVETAADPDEPARTSAVESERSQRRHAAAAVTEH